MNRLWATIDGVSPLPERPGFGIVHATATALAAVAVAVLLRSALGISLPLLPVLVAVIVTAAKGGLWPALLTHAVATPLVIWLVPMRGITDSLMVAAMFAGVSLAFGLASEMVLRARVAAEGDLWRLRQREAYLQSIFDTLPASLIVVDDDGHVLAANRCAEELFGRTVDDLCRQVVSDLLDLPHDRGLISHQSKAHSGPLGTMADGVRPDGSRIELAIATAEMTVAQHQFRSIYLRDETRRRQVELRLAELQAEVEQLGRASALGQLGAAIAHELNQPMGSAALYAGALKTMLAHGDVAEAIETADLVQAQLFRAQAVLSRLRNFVQLSQPEMDWVPAAALMVEAAHLAQMAVRQVAAELKVDVHPAVGDLFADRVQVQQILLNLVLNAAEAVRGRPRRQLRLGIAPDGAEQVRISVADTGPGVAEHIRSRLFRPFVTGKPDGLGVGLAISRSIVEAHGGRIWHEETGRGASFHFTLKHREKGAWTDAA